MNATLQEVNHKLHTAGFPGLTPEQAQALKTVTDRNQFLVTLGYAETGDPHSQDQIRSTLHQLGVAVDTPPENDASHPVAPEAPEPQEPQGNGEARQFDSFHVYGSKAALCFEPTVTRKGQPTVTVDAAAKSGHLQYDWANKVRLQLTVTELPVVAATFLGYRGGCEFKNHGPNNDKGISITNQAGEGRVFVRVFASGANHPVPVSMPDAYWVSTYLLSQLRAHSPWMDGATLEMLLSRTAAYTQ